MIRGNEVHEIEELKRSGMSIRGISRMTGLDRKTIRKCLVKPEGRPVYGPRPVSESKLASHKAYLEERLRAGVWNAQVLLRELRERGYEGGYTILKDWLHPQRAAASTVAVRRFETPPGKQAQVDWGYLGTLAQESGERKLWCFVLTMGYSRRMVAEAALDTKLGTLLQMHETAFRDMDGVPEEILYDRMKTVWLDVDDRGEVIWNPVFVDFARYWGFQPRLCRPYRAQTKGKVESGVKYVRRNFLCGLQGREPGSLAELNAQLREWVAAVANQRVHGTTREQIAVRWDGDQFHMQDLAGRLPYPFRDDELRKVARDAYVSWQGNRYSVPWRFAGNQVWVRQQGGSVEVLHHGERIAAHECVDGRHRVVTQAEHHRGIPLGPSNRSGKIQVHLREQAPSVQVRPLAAYNSVMAGGVQ